MMTDKIVMSDEITFDGIRDWYVSIFKKLGWMVLAKDKYPNKVKQYKFSIEKWLEKTNFKLNKEMPEHLKDDIRILRQNMLVLDIHVRSIFADILVDGKSGIVLFGGCDDIELDNVIEEIYNLKY